MLTPVTLILTLCLASSCIEKAPFSPIPPQICVIQGQAIAAKWIDENMPTYRLEAWSCQGGARKSAT